MINLAMAANQICLIQDTVLRQEYKKNPGTRSPLASRIYSAHSGDCLIPGLVGMSIDNNINVTEQPAYPILYATRTAPAMNNPYPFSACTEYLPFRQELLHLIRIHVATDSAYFSQFL